MRRRRTLLAGCLCVASGLTLGAFSAAEAMDDAFVEGSPFYQFLQGTTPSPKPDADPALGNHVHIIEEGYDALLLRVHLIRTARHTIDIQTFIWASDECAQVLRYELLKAAQRGVKVRVIADSISSAKDAEQLAISTMASPNVAIKVYRPTAGQLKASVPVKTLNLFRFSALNQRMHVKTVIVDGVAGITGGRNIDNNYYNYSLGYNFKDRDVLVVGPAVAAMAVSFDEFWAAPESISSRDLRDVARIIEQGAPPSSLTEDAVYTGTFFQDLNREADEADVVREKFVESLMPARRVTYVADAPGIKKKHFYISEGYSGRTTQAVLELFKNARESIIVQSPYVIVNRRSSKVFRKLQKENPGLRIRISTNSFGAADHLITYAANYRLRSRVSLSLGMEVFEYKPHPEDLMYYVPNFAELEQRALDEGLSKRPYLSIHAKSYVFDDDVAFIGTFNFDPRSFYLNSEDGFIIEDQAVVRGLKAQLERDMAPENSWPIAKKNHPFFAINRGIEGLSTRAPVDFWPFRSTSAYELLAGHAPVSAEDPKFYAHYKNIGKFPGSDGPSTSTVTVRILKVFGKPATPLL